MNFYLFILVAEKFIFGHSVAHFSLRVACASQLKSNLRPSSTNNILRLFVFLRPTLPWQYGFEPNGHQYKKNTHKGCFFLYW
jgi:hypothetical protein